MKAQLLSMPAAGPIWQDAARRKVVGEDVLILRQPCHCGMVALKTRTR